VKAYPDRGNHYRKLTAGNEESPVWQSVITRHDTGTPTATVPEYDADGNLRKSANDARVDYGSEFIDGIAHKMSLLSSVVKGLIAAMNVVGSQLCKE
jgi:hypothetical protein